VAITEVTFGEAFVTCQNCEIHTKNIPEKNYIELARFTLALSWGETADTQV
jgi:hypothetical protein